MTYQEYVKEVFLEHYNCMGQDLEEAADIFSETKFPTIEKWLTKIGYDLNEYLFEEISEGK
jgi:hypothetical protein